MAIVIVDFLGERSLLRKTLKVNNELQLGKGAVGESAQCLFSHSKGSSDEKRAPVVCNLNALLEKLSVLALWGDEINALIFRWNVTPLGGERGKGGNGGLNEVVGQV